MNNLYIGWNDEDTTTNIYKKELLGIRSLNKLDKFNFKLKLCEYVKYIKPKKINGIEMYLKHDINNGIFTLLQLNDNLESSKYELVNKMRELLWLCDDYEYITYDKICLIIMK